MAGQTTRNTHPITSSDTIALITNTVMPAINNIQADLKVVDEIKGEIKVINNKLENIESDTKEVNQIINKFRVTLYGNGDAEKGGLVTTVAKIQDWIDTRSSIEKSVIASGIVLIVGDLIGLIYIVIKLQAIH